MLEAAALALERTTGLKARILPPKPTGNADALLQIKTPQRTHRFLADVKAVDRFETPALVKARRRGEGAIPILVAPYITRETAQHCKDLQLPFIDTAGNAYIQTQDLLIYVVGQPRPTGFRSDRFRALTPAGLQLTFAILCRPDLLQTNYRTIAAAAKVGLGTIGPVFKDLQTRKIIQFAPKGSARVGDHRGLLDEWVTHYPITLRPKLTARRLEAEPQSLKGADLKPYHAFWGGEAAADRLTHMLQPAAFTIYTAGPWAPLAAAHHLRARPDGNVEILKAFWNFTVEGLDADLAPPPLIYADLMATRDGRNMELANLIYDRFIEPKFHHTR